MYIHTKTTLCMQRAQPSTQTRTTSLPTSFVPAKNWPKASSTQRVRRISASQLSDSSCCLRSPTLSARCLNRLLRHIMSWYLRSLTRLAQCLNRLLRHIMSWYLRSPTRLARCLNRLLRHIMNCYLRSPTRLARCSNRLLRHIMSWYLRSPTRLARCLNRPTCTTCLAEFLYLHSYIILFVRYGVVE